ncbi:MAG: glycerol-3-phosphate acyltransferase [Trueperaceae bacterium]
MTDLLALVAGFLVGSVPLGSLYIRVLTGREARDFSVHNLGVENVLYFISAPVAIASFLLDVIKAFLVLSVCYWSGSGLLYPALGVYLGHLYPLPFRRIFLRQKLELPRGRGNGTLLGIFAAWLLFETTAWWLIALPLLVYGGFLLTTRYVSLATLAGLIALFTAALSANQSVAASSGVLMLVATWRHRNSLARILDKTEPMLGDPPSVHGRNPNVVLAAFMIHPITLEDLWQPRSQRWLEKFVKKGWLKEKWLVRLLPHLNPRVQDEISGIRLKDGRELRVLLIGGPMLPEQIRNDEKSAVKMAIKGAKLARARGAEAFGLGAFWSTVGNKGLEVQEAVPNLAITNGGAYTAATVKAAVPGLLKSFANEGGNLRQSCAAVVGANGVVAFGIARVIAPEVAEVILIGRDAERLERSAESLRAKYPQTQIHTSTTMAACAEADLIFTATSDPMPVLYPKHVKPGAWIFDLGRPADVNESVRDTPGVHVIPGGVVKPPGDMRNHLDLHFGNGMIPACMAETMLMTATRAFDRKSLGAQTKTSDLEFYLQEGERLGFEIVTRDERVAKVSELV